MKRERRKFSAAFKSKVAIEYCKKNNIEYKFYLGEQNELKENLSYIFNNK